MLRKDLKIKGMRPGITRPADSARPSQPHISDPANLSDNKFSAAGPAGHQPHIRIHTNAGGTLSNTRKHDPGRPVTTDPQIPAAPAPHASPATSLSRKAWPNSLHRLKVCACQSILPHTACQPISFDMQMAFTLEVGHWLGARRQPDAKSAWAARAAVQLPSNMRSSRHST